ncbi:MAG: class I SAM-dependent methyltransferase [Bradyrhizobiaceae bacterium]|nr:class I SAM-dependent methyltransferase [Bradyrhizobiaceae bacterium]
MDAIVAPFKKLARRRPPDPKKLIPEITPAQLALIERYRPFTMTSIERQWALISAVEYLNRTQAPGDIVECGTWRGGNMLLAKDLCHGATIERKFYLYDTFTGMSEPTEHDVSNSGLAAAGTFEERRKEEYVDWAYASVEDVRRNFEQAGLLDHSVRFVKGKVEDTLADPANLPDRIALLRLDTDWYESTKMELETLYPRLVSGGILIIDDYGHWKGARKAVDEYFANETVLMLRIDYTARLMIRR